MSNRRGPSSPDPRRERSPKGSSRRAALSVGLVYETFDSYPPKEGEPADAHVEYEPESTIGALEEAIRELGHRPVRLGSPLDLLAQIQTRDFPKIDAAFNLAEGFGTRNREAWAPVLLEMGGVPTLGSDAATLSLTLDKAWANRHAAAAEIPVPAHRIYASAEEIDETDLPGTFPLFVKPRWEGTAKGIRATSKVINAEGLRREVERIVEAYAQPALVEVFVGGAEYTVTLIGNDPVEVLPVVQRALERESGIGLHALEGPGDDGGPFEYEIKGGIDAALESRLAILARRSFEIFECRDFARVDFRLDLHGEPIFLEINPLPTFATDGTFAILAELEGVSLSAMLGRCVSAGLERLGVARKEA